MKTGNGITFIHIPAALFKLTISSVYEMVILALAVSFGETGLKLSNSALASLLQNDRRQIPRILRRLEAKQYITISYEGHNRVIQGGIKVMSADDIKTMSGRHQSDVKVTSKLPPIIKEVKGTKGRKRTSNHKASGQRFAIFWEHWPKKVDKSAASKVFAKLNPDDELLGRIIAAVDAWKQSADWTKDEGQFIPGPAKWLRNKRWTDELPESVQPGTRDATDEEAEHHARMMGWVK